MSESTVEYQWFVGIDWAKDKVDVWCSARGTRRGRWQEFPHSAAGNARLVAWLRERSGNKLETVAVAIETPAHPTVDALLEAGVAVFSINPKQLDRFRDRYSVAGAKDDRRDAMVLGECLKTDLHLYRQVEPLDPNTAALREAQRAYQRLQGSLADHANQLRDLLWRYAPEILALNGGADEPWFWELLSLGLDPQRSRRLRPKTVASLLRRHRKRSLEAATVLAVLREPRLGLNAGIEPQLLLAAADLVAVLQTIERSLAGAESRLKELVAQSGLDAQVIDSLPGVAEIGTAVFLAEAHDAIKHRDLDQLRTRCGTAPVTKRSGKTSSVVMRRACNPYLRVACWHMARTAVCHDPWAKDLYIQMTARGVPYNTALRAIADRLLKRMVALLRDAAFYDPNHWKPVSLAAAGA